MKILDDDRLHDFIVHSQKLALTSSGDVHGDDRRVILYLKDCNSEQDLSFVILTGDYNPRETYDEGLCEKEIGKIFEILRQSKRQVLILGGNYEIPGISTRAAIKIGDPLYPLGSDPLAQSKPFPGHFLNCEGFCVIGLEGSNPINGRFPGERQEEELEWALEKTLAKTELKDTTNMILVTHVPPFNSESRDELMSTGLPPSYWGKHVGSTAVRSFIEKYKPILNICGHVHEGVGATIFLWKGDGPPVLTDIKMQAYEKIAVLLKKNGNSRATICVNHGTLESWNYMFYRIAETDSILAVEVSKRRLGGKDALTRMFEGVVGKKSKSVYNRVIDPDGILSDLAI